MSDAPVVETRDGKLRGLTTPHGLTFRGIPYGQDTGGTRRFLAPAAPIKWTGIRDATVFGHRAPQAGRTLPSVFDWLVSRHPSSEDCLVLNVSTRSLVGKMPVMVWLHGGGFLFGSTDIALSDGGPLAAHADVVVVTVNHRLSVFGFVGAPHDDPQFADSGNAGMLDLVLALEWVRDNIAQFGGDPGCVTVFGESGGAAKAAILMGMPCATGLFHRAIIQSPSTGFRVQEAEDAWRFSKALLKHLQIGSAGFGALQKVPAPDLLAAMASVVQAHDGADHFRPSIDGRSILAHPFYPQPAESIADIPLMIGTNSTEATFFLSQLADSDLTTEVARARAQRLMKLSETDADSLWQSYLANHSGASPNDLLVLIATDHAYRLTAIEGAEKKVEFGAAPVFLYQFDWTSAAGNGFLRSPHGAELPFVFGTTHVAQELLQGGSQVEAMRRQMMDAWTRFAAHGDPNGDGLPAWTRLRTTGRDTMVLDAPRTRMEADPRGNDLTVMARYPRFLPGSPYSF